MLVTQVRGAADAHSPYYQQLTLYTKKVIRKIWKLLRAKRKPEPFQISCPWCDSVVKTFWIVDKGTVE